MLYSSDIHPSLSDEIVLLSRLGNNFFFLRGLIWYESTSGFSEISGHCFHVIYFITSSASVSVVYFYAQGVDGEIPRYRMAHKIKIFELLMALLWFQLETYSTKYKATYIHLFLMRLFCYQGLVTTFFYGVRVWYESTSGFSEISGHCFRVIYFITSSASVSAVYVYAQGVDGEVPRYRMAHKIKIFELLMALLWFQGAGVDLLNSVSDILDQGA